MTTHLSQSISPADKVPGRHLALCLLILPVLVCLVFSSQYATTFAVTKEAIAWLGLLVCSSLWRPLHRGPWLPWLGWLGFVGWFGLALLWSPDALRGVRALQMWLLLLLWMMLLRQHLQASASEKDLTAKAQRLMLWWSCAAAFSGLLALLQSSGWLSLGLHRVTGTIGNPNRLAGVLLLALPTAGWCIHSPAVPRARLFGGLVGLSCLAGLWATGCHSAWLGALCMGGFWFLCRLIQGATTRKAVKRLRWRIAWSVAIAGFGVLWLWQRHSLGWLWRGIESRWWLAQMSWRVWRQHLWVGLGPGGYPQQVAWVQADMLAHSPRSWTPLLDPHHQLFDVAIATGFVGLVLLCLALGWWLWPLRHSFWKPHGQAVAGALLGASVYALSETPMLSVTFVLMFGGWLVLARWQELVDVGAQVKQVRQLARWEHVRSNPVTPALREGEAPAELRADVILSTILDSTDTPHSASTGKVKAKVKAKHSDPYSDKYGDKGSDPYNDKTGDALQTKEASAPGERVAIWRQWMALLLWVSCMSVASWGTFAAVRSWVADRWFGAGLASAALATPAGREQAVRYYQRALGGANEPADVLLSQGLAWRDLGHFKQALRAIQRSFALRPTPERALAIADIYFVQKRVDEAIRWGKRSIRLHPRYARGYHNVGVMYLSRWQLPEAWRYLRRARSLRPGDRQIRRSWRRLPRSWRRRKVSPR